ncbi:helicase HerA domain-containing protein [Synechococcus sp. PCC 7336]|uniref:helicase HerA domain-containing protein n=1 Tax=Synechococcus sp. PCC 7336 TaxID=195250 RepID=UPI00034AA475|nr:DUF87 domain-containing protein [Synechococcus sp. PCC 7336]
MADRKQVPSLQALAATDFDWTMHLKSVWRDSNSDVEGVHRDKRDKIARELKRLQGTKNPNSPLGMIFVGQAGAGKTHLLSAVRKQALAQNFGFVLADMTDVRDFWETILQGYVSSLQEADASGQPQSQRLIEFLIQQLGIPISLQKFSNAEPPALKKYTNVVLKTMFDIAPQEVRKFQDVIRALLLLNSNDFAASELGYNWLQGLAIEEAGRAEFGFSQAIAKHHSNIVEGLSWLMSLRGPSVLALDQLDAIIAQHNIAIGSNVDEEMLDEQRVSKSIIEGIAGGLMELRDKTRRTLIVLSCLEGTWAILNDKAVSPAHDRFQPPILLGPVLSDKNASQIVELRLQEAYQNFNFNPPYPTWPFTQQFFEAAKGEYPRSILKCCDLHREQCLSKGEITELSSLISPPPIIDPSPIEISKFDRELEEAKKRVDLEVLRDETNEDRVFGSLLQTAGDCLVTENSTPDSVDALVDVDFPGGKSYKTLHARLRLVFHNEDDREKHLCLRVLQKKNSNAYKARLKAAMTASGIDRALSFRKLGLVRTLDLPGGAATQKLTREFEDNGGLFLYPAEDEMRTLGALHQLTRNRSSEFDEWLRKRRPVSQLTCFKDAVDWLFEGAIAEPVGVPAPSLGGSSTTETPSRTNGSHSISNSGAPAPSTTNNPPPGSPPGPRDLPIGARLIGDRPRETLSLKVENLTKHAVVLAGSGSGKTVLVKRLVEEAALMGIPSIVIDCANDLARMGDRWPTHPESWRNEDDRKEAQYCQQAEVVVWTPGREDGNPLNLEPIPDLAAVARDPSELNRAADMARDTLQEIVAPGNSQTAILKRGILKAALEYFAKDGGGNLTDFVELLSELPPEAGGGIAKADKKARDMADTLRAEILNNPLLRHSGSALDPAILFGLNSQSGKTRISIVNFVGLSGLNAQQQFLNQLSMTLFTWIKKNPAPADQSLRGLLVIDEAKDFIPSQRTSPCKDNINRLAAQARKYGLGLVFATQAPKSIDHNIVANCSTQFYGRANSPAAIAAIKEQLNQRGGGGHDLARLAKGQFYVVGETIATPTKIQAPLCLSYHPQSPLDELEVLARAKVHRKSL